MLIGRFASTSRRQIPALVLLGVMTIICLMLWSRVLQAPEASLIRPERSTGDEVVMVVIASSTCPVCRDPEFAQIVDQIRTALYRQVKAEGRTFVAMAVAPETYNGESADFLDEIGPFHEISVGRGWLNSGALRYVWNDFEGPASTPQILVVERQLHISREPGAPVVAVVSADLKRRTIGLDELRRWARELGMS